MSCEKALAHSWMAAFESGELETKNLSKEKMKKFLARQKWKVTPRQSGSTVIFELLFLGWDFWRVFFFLLAKQKAGKALLALKRMALLSKGDSNTSTTSPRQGKANFFIVIFLLLGSTWMHIGPVVPNVFSVFLPLVPESLLSPQAMHALKSLEDKMQGPPQFTKSLQDQTVAPGSSARLSCHLAGTHRFLSWFPRSSSFWTFSSRTLLRGSD